MRVVAGCYLISFHNQSCSLTKINLIEQYLGINWIAKFFKVFFHIIFRGFGVVFGAVKVVELPNCIHSVYAASQTIQNEIAYTGIWQLSLPIPPFFQIN